MNLRGKVIISTVSHSSYTVTHSAPSSSIFVATRKRTFNMFQNSQTMMSHMTQFASKKRPRVETIETKNKEKKQRMMEMDRFKKIQCSVALKRLMVHRDGWAFKNTNTKDVDDEWKPSIDLDSVKCKLDNGLYINPNQFANDIRDMFSHAMLHYPVRHEIHKITLKLSELFEMKWKALEEM